MTTTTERSTTKSRKKIWAACGAGALAFALVGGGALTTLSTAIQGNEFRAAVPTEEQPAGALLRLDGDPLSYTFDSSTYNDQVQTVWTLSNVGQTDAPFDGQLEVVGEVSEALAQALHLEYGVVDDDGTVRAWRSAGTLAESRSFAETLSLGEATIAGGTEVPVAVRVLLPDPTGLQDEGEVGELLEVVADFTVSYLDPLDRTDA